MKFAFNYMCNFIKLLSSISYFTIGFAIILIVEKPTLGYEISIYDSITPLAWNLIAISLLCGILTTILALFDNSKKFYWFLGFSAILFNNLIILMIPSLRGYVFNGRSDLMSHIGYVRDILVFRHLYNTPSQLQVYPATHVFLAAASLITNIDPIRLIDIFYPYIYLVYVTYMYLLAKELFLTSKLAHLTMVCATVLLLSQINFQVLPYAVSILTAPGILYTYIVLSKRKSIGFTLILLQLLLFLPFLHPMTSAVFIGLIFILEVFKVFINIFLRIQNNKDSLFFYKPLSLVIPGAMLFIIFTIWLWHNWAYWSLSVNIIYDLISGKISVGALQDVSDALGRITMTTSEIVILFFKMFGHQFAYLLISFFTLLLLLINYRKNKTLLKNWKMLLIITYFFCSIIIFIFHLSNRITATGYWRFLDPITLISPLFVALALSRLIISRKNTTWSPTLVISACFVTLVLFLVSWTSINTFYPSINTRRPNHQISRAELDGIHWYYDRKEILYNTLVIKPKYLFGELLFGYLGAYERGDILYPPYSQYSGEFVVPAHFNFRGLEKNKISQDNKLPFYLLISKFDKAFHTEVYPELEEFTGVDFAQLQFNPILNKVYTNPEFDIWFINQASENVH